VSPRRRVVTAVVVVLLLAAGVAGVWAVQASGGGGGDETAKVATASETTTSAAPTAQPPTIANQGEDWEAIMRSLYGYLTWVLQHPTDPALIEHYALTTCPCYEGLAAKVRGYVEKGQHEVGPGSEIVSVRLNSVAFRHPNGRPRTVSLYVVERIRAKQLVDRTGAVVDRVGDRAPCGFLVDLADGGDGRWRISQVDRGGAPGTGAPCP
jgi:hypothetical protein